MAEYLSPGVYVEEFDSGSVPMEGVSTSTAGFVGLAQRGPTEGSPILVTNVADFRRKFGGFLSENEFGNYRYLAYAVNHFFANGGSRAYVMRVAPNDAEQANNFEDDIDTQVLKICATSAGDWGNRIVIAFSPSSKAKTQILEVSENSFGKKQYKLKNGSGFNAGDIVEFNDGTSKKYNRIESIDDRLVTFAEEFDVNVIDNDLLPQKTIQTCEMNMEVKYEDIVEFYENVSLNIQAPNFITKKLAKSDLIEVDAAPVEEIKHPFETLGLDKNNRIALKDGKNGSYKALDSGSFIGEDKGPGKRTGIQAFIDNNEVSIMAVPGIVDPNVQLSLVAHCENQGSRFAILDIPRELRTVNDVISHKDMIDSQYAAIYHPWLEVFDPLDKKNMFIPPSGSIAGVYARTDNTRGVHKAPANETINNCAGLDCSYNTGEQDILNPKGINLIRKFPGQGIRVWGARTCSSNALWKYVNVRRLFIYLEESIKSYTNWVVFEPNDELLWIRVKRTVEVFLEDVWRSGALSGSNTAEAFFVDIGKTTMSKDDIDNGRLVCVIGVAPVKPAEFVIFRITQKTGE